MLIYTCIIYFGHKEWILHSPCLHCPGVNFASTIDTLGHLGGMDREPIAQYSMHMHFTQLSYTIPFTTLYIALINELFFYYMFLQTQSNPEYMKAYLMDCQKL